MVNAETVRKDTHDTVIGSPFTRVPGLPTFEAWENFLEEAQESALGITVEYDWAGDHGLLVEIVGDVKYNVLTGGTLVPYTTPTRPPTVDANVLAGNLTDKAARIATLENDQMKLNWAAVEGFRSGFNANFRNTFDAKYYEQLKEEVFKYKRIRPLQFIEHMQKKWVKMDTLVISRLRTKFFRGWEEDEHLISFRVRLLREQKKLKGYSTPVEIEDVDLCQHYMEEILKKSDLFGERCIIKWNTKPAPDKVWPHPHVYFEKRMKDVEEYEAIGGRGNTYATANAATELKEGLEATMVHALTKANEEHALAIGELKSGFNEQLSELTKAISMMAKASTANKENETPKKRRRKNRYVYESSSDDYTSEEEETPPRKRNDKKKKSSSRRDRAAPAGGFGFSATAKYRKGMKFNTAWTNASRQNFLKARRIYHDTGTTEARADRIAMLKETQVRMKGKRTQEDDDRLSDLIKRLEDSPAVE